MTYTDNDFNPWESLLADRVEVVYQVGEIVTVRVERVRSRGIDVRFENGAEGYIRPREMTLSANADPRSILTAGQTIRAIVIKLGLPGLRPELSLRRLEPDPWPTFIKRYHLGDVIPVTVKHIYADRVVVEHVPGVDGNIPLYELQPGKNPTQPDKILKVGDRTEAAIIYLDKTHKRLILSIRRWAERQATTDALIDFFASAGSHIETEPLTEEMAQCLSFEPAEPVKLAGPILIVEDQEDVRRSLQARLQNDGYEVAAAASAQEAISLFDEHAFALAIIDIDMPSINGLELISWLAEQKVAMPVAVMSAPDLILQEYEHLRGLGISFAFDKPLDMIELQDGLRRLAHGERPTLTGYGHHDELPTEVSGFRTLAASLRNGGGMERLQMGLEQLCKSTQADIGVLFHLNVETKTTKIVAKSGLPGLNLDDLYRLPESPVKDVIVEEEILWRHRVSSDRSGRFRNLLLLFPFESCIGIPIEIGGQVEHALFLFARRPEVFNTSRLREAMATSILFQSVLENELLDEHILSASQIFLTGQIASAITHEVSSKVMALDSQIFNSQRALERVLEGELDKGLLELREWLGRMTETVAGLRETTGNLVRLKDAKQEHLVNVAQVLEQAERLVSLEAQRGQVVIRLLPDENLPPALANPNRIHHVFVNLLLNAVQWTQSLPGRKGRVRVSASLVEIDETLWIRIHFSDNGPGIHHNMWDRIFGMGITTRKGGSGLGLYIARSLVESMGGRLYVKNSLMMLGTTLAVELPAARES